MYLVIRGSNNVIIRKILTCAEMKEIKPVSIFSYSLFLTQHKKTIQQCLLALLYRSHGMRGKFQGMDLSLFLTIILGYGQ
jgi:hypothetical protein